MADLFKRADADGAGRLSFHAFERFCATCQHANLEEDQVLDLFDEAIRVTEELTGEETDTVVPMTPPMDVAMAVSLTVSTVCISASMSTSVPFGGAMITVSATEPGRS